jgi:putative endonuclease
MVGRDSAIYIMAGGRNGTLYIGVTSELEQRVSQHKRGAFAGFSKHYGCTRLVWFEAFGAMEAAIRREKALKGWNRDWKLKPIEAANPDGRDLSDGWWAEER